MALVAAVFRQSLLRPCGQRFVAIIVVAVAGEIETDFTPGDQLIKKLFYWRTYAPPALAATADAMGELGVRPFFAGHQIVKHLVRGNVAEMKMGRKAAAAFFVWFVARFGIAVELLRQKLTPFFPCHSLSPANGGWENLVVDRQFLERFGIFQPRQWRRRPALEDFPGQRLQFGKAQAL